jgi:hypothetical protein
MIAGALNSERSAVAPLPLAGRGRGWGYFARSSLAILLPSGGDKHLGLPLGFTPPLTPPRQGEGDLCGVCGAGAA